MKQPPVAPKWYQHAEANAWENGWEAGYEACLRDDAIAREESSRLQRERD